MRLKKYLVPCVLLCASLRAAEHKASSSADMDRLIPGLQPGDTIVLNKGAWADQIIHVNSKGTADKPITLRAETPGKTVFTGKSALMIDGEYVIVSGLLFKNCGDKGDGIALKGNHNRLTETSMEGGTFKFFMHLFGSENRVDHCYLDGKTSDSPTMQIEAEGTPNHHRIDHNHFGPRPPLGRNGGETMRVGYSGQSMNNSNTLVELNLFDRCDGEIEIISSKSCENVYVFNTFLDCDGMLTLRHGNRCLIAGNFFIGHRKKGSGGVRIIGEDHVVANNYFEGLDKGAFWITSGVKDSPLNAYFRARNCTIAFNTVVDSRGFYIDLSAGFGTSNRTLMPENITIANNLFSVPKDATLLKNKEGEGYKWAGNLAQCEGALPAHEGIKSAELKLEKNNNGLWTPTTESPARGAAAGDFIEKIPGRDNLSKKHPDAGYNGFADDSIPKRPLSATDVGPSWRR